MKKLALTLALLAPLTAQAGDLKNNFAGCKTAESLDEMITMVTANDMGGAAYLIARGDCIITSDEMEASYLGLDGLFSATARVRVYLPSEVVTLFVPIEALDEVGP